MICRPRSMAKFHICLNDSKQRTKRRSQQSNVVNHSSSRNLGSSFSLPASTERQEIASRGKRVANLPKVFIRIGSSNPTQLLGKEQEICSSGIDVSCLSETSHTRKAQCIIRSRCKVQKFSCAFGAPVPDLSDKCGGSLRGFAQGVATISRFPVFDGSHLLDLDHNLVHRIQIVVVQLMHVPVRIINLYLKPGS